MKYVRITFNDALRKKWNIRQVDTLTGSPLIKKFRFDNKRCKINQHSKILLSTPLIYFIIRELKPVCGKNGITYNNPCIMICAGITSQCGGKCPCNFGGDRSEYETKGEETQDNATEYENQICRCTRSSTLFTYENVLCMCILLIVWGIITTNVFI